MSRAFKGTELSAEERRVLARLIGRPIEDDEVLAIHASRVIKDAPEGDARTQAAKELSETMDRFSARVADVPDDELDRLVDEALLHVRGRSH